MRVVAWPRATLIDLLEENPNIAGAVQSAINADLVRKALDPDHNPQLARDKAVQREKQMERLKERTTRARTQMARIMKEQKLPVGGTADREKGAAEEPALSAATTSAAVAVGGGCDGGHCFCSCC